MISKTITAVAAVGLLLTPSLAAANPAGSLSVASAPAVERTGAQVDDSNELRGRGRWVIYAIALALIVWGAIELLGDDDPESP